MSQSRPVRLHWLTQLQSPLCGYQAPFKDDVDLSQVPYCGACLLVLMFMQVHSDSLLAGCRPPDLRPSQAAKLLEDTPWAELMPLGSWGSQRDTWWFETGAVAKSGATS